MNDPIRFVIHPGELSFRGLCVYYAVAPNTALNANSEQYRGYSESYLASLAHLYPATDYPLAKTQAIRARCERMGWTDFDGIVIPDKWRSRPDNWMALGETYRRAESDRFLNPPPKKVKRTRAPGAAGAFTTKAAKAWARRQGWKIVDEERSEAYQAPSGRWVRRTHDLMIGADLMVECPGITGMTLIQAGGKGERKPHLARFEERGGADACRARACRFVYVEFVRGEPVIPTLVEWWVE